MSSPDSDGSYEEDADLNATDGSSYTGSDSTEYTTTTVTETTPESSTTRTVASEDQKTDYEADVTHSSKYYHAHYLQIKTPPDIMAELKHNKLIKVCTTLKKLQNDLDNLEMLTALQAEDGVCERKDLKKQYNLKKGRKDSTTSDLSTSDLDIMLARPPDPDTLTSNVDISGIDTDMSVPSVKQRPKYDVKMFPKMCKSWDNIPMPDVREFERKVKPLFKAAGRLIDFNRTPYTFKPILEHLFDEASPFQSVPIRPSQFLLNKIKEDMHPSTSRRGVTKGSVSKAPSVIVHADTPRSLSGRRLSTIYDSPPRRSSKDTRKGRNTANKPAFDEPEARVSAFANVIHPDDDLPAGLAENIAEMRKTSADLVLQSSGAYGPQIDFCPALELGIGGAHMFSKHKGTDPFLTASKMEIGSPSGEDEPRHSTVDQIAHSLWGPKTRKRSSSGHSRGITNDISQARRSMSTAAGGRHGASQYMQRRDTCASCGRRKSSAA